MTRGGIRYKLSYTGMKVVKTAVSLPADTYRRAERLRKKMGKSRSELVADALTALIRRADAREREERDAAAYAAAPDAPAEVARAAREAAAAWAKLDDDDWSDHAA